MLVDPTADPCVACGADHWRPVAPEARQCTRCGYESGPGWLALRTGRGFALDDMILRLSDEPIENELVSLETITDIALDAVFAANE